MLGIIPSTIDELSGHNLRLSERFLLFASHFELKKFHQVETICRAITQGILKGTQAFAYEHNHFRCLV